VHLSLAGPGTFAAQLPFSQHFVDYVKQFDFSLTGRKWDPEAKVWRFGMGCYDQVGGRAGQGAWRGVAWCVGCRLVCGVQSGGEAGRSGGLKQGPADGAPKPAAPAQVVAALRAVGYRVLDIPDRLLQQQEGGAGEHGEPPGSVPLLPPHEVEQLLAKHLPPDLFGRLYPFQQEGVRFGLQRCAAG
jgi:hypothetical protein